MAKNVLLNNIEHRDLRVITRYAAEYGDNVATAMIVPTEFGDIQREYPIFFRHDAESDSFTAIVLLGLQKDENLFLDEKGWNASYVPAVLARGPFFIGFQQQTVNGQPQNVPVVNLDIEHVRVSKTEGEPLFKADGTNTAYLERIANMLNAIGVGMDVSKPMFEAFKAAGLIEPVKLEIKLNSEEQYDLHGMFTINQQKLANLDAETLHSLHRSGYLQGAFLVASSLSNVQRLIELKARRRHRQAEIAS